MTRRSQRRIVELAERYALPAGAAESLDALLDLLAHDPTAPTAITDPARAADAHVSDALVALELDAVRAARSIADLGSGAGFPGLVLAAALPDARVWLVEASSKKCAFLERAVCAMRLSNVEVAATRVEEWVDGAGRCDLVTARAVAPLNVLVEYAAPLLIGGGALVAWKGRRDDEDERDGAAAAAATGLAPARVLAVRPWSGAERLHLHLYLKVGLTPHRYPRRPGIARKQPLRASGSAAG